MVDSVRANVGYYKHVAHESVLVKNVADVFRSKLVAYGGFSSTARMASSAGTPVKQNSQDMPRTYVARLL